MYGAIVDGGGGAIFYLFFGSRGPPPGPGGPKQLRGPRQLLGMPNGMRRLCLEPAKSAASSKVLTVRYSQCICGYLLLF